MNPNPRFLLAFLPIRMTLLTCLVAATSAYLSAQQSTRSPTGSLNSARAQHSATLLDNGKVLVVGGANGVQNINSAELYDPGTGVWTATGSLRDARSSHVAVRLGNGKVLVAGGVGNPGLTVLSSSELYDPNTGTWSPTGDLSVGRRAAQAVRLADGKVLIAGGFPLIGGLPAPDNSTSEVYDPATGQWSPTGPLNNPHAHSTLTALPDGKVLIAGGSKGRNAELYDPVTRSWAVTGQLITARQQHSATLLANGKVLVVGGGIVSGVPLLTESEIYDPGTGLWTATGSMATVRLLPTLTLLENGQALVAAGSSLPFAVRSAELYGPATGAWTPAPDLNVARSDHSATLLNNGKILIAAGANSNASSTAILRTAELFDHGGVANLSSASLLPGPAAPESFVTAKSSGALANTTVLDPSQNRNPGTTLGGTTVKVKDSTGVEALARLDYVSPTQVNYIVPSGLANGSATVTITSGDGTVSTSNLQIQNVAPALFTLNDSGLAAGAAARLRNGVQSIDQIFQDTAVGRIALPIDLGPDTDQVALVLYGTGLRFRSGLSNVSVKIAGIDALVIYADVQSEYPGLDQINVLLPRSLAGLGLVNVKVIVDGKDANIVRVNIR